MDKRFWISGIVVAAVALALNYIVHGWLLQSDYMQHPDMFRSAGDASQHYLGWLVVAHLLIGFAFTWIYRHGVSTASTFGQGLRYGVAMSALVSVPMYLTYYAVQPMPGMLVVKQVVCGVIVMLILGVLVACLNPRTAA
jgi:hypothetical protein